MPGQDAFRRTTVPPGPGMPRERAEALASDKSYGTAVALSAAVGFLGVQHFYLGRVGEGLLDLGLSLAWIYCFATGAPLLGVVFFLADWGHSLTVTILLLTGNFRDGEGRLVCYPGQKAEPWRTP
jgi:TM2 domain-containing membrane protein YozV